MSGQTRLDRLWAPKETQRLFSGKAHFGASFEVRKSQTAIRGLDAWTWRRFQMDKCNRRTVWESWKFQKLNGALSQDEHSNEHGSRKPTSIKSDCRRHTSIVASVRLCRVCRRDSRLVVHLSSFRAPLQRFSAIISHCSQTQLSGLSLFNIFFGRYHSVPSVIRLLADLHTVLFTVSGKVITGLGQESIEFKGRLSSKSRHIFRNKRWPQNWLRLCNLQRSGVCFRTGDCQSRNACTNVIQTCHRRFECVCESARRLANIIIHESWFMMQRVWPEIERDNRRIADLPKIDL